MWGFLGNRISEEVASRNRGFLLLCDFYTVKVRGACFAEQDKDHPSSRSHPPSDDDEHSGLVFVRLGHHVLMASESKTPSPEA